jgi:hypothetical protein
MHGRIRLKPLVRPGGCSEWVVVGALSAALLLTPSALVLPPSASAASKSCGSIQFDHKPLRIVVLRGTTCTTARRVARYYDKHFVGPRPWECFLARAGDPEKIACAWGGRSGNVQKWPHAFVGK